MYTKKNSRNTYKTHRRPIYKKNGGYQNSKGRNRGNISQQYNKYLKLAKESSRSGDRIQSEYYYQFTDHYYRLMVELGINIEDNTQTEEIKHVSDEQSSDDNVNSNNDTSEEKSENDSIESIPFIAEPSKEKRTRSSK
tara:strand:- start:327 stop:740 length:414 start_codon:yes stop_codon:yes gene_type:complete